MKKISKQETLLFNKIKEQKDRIDENEFIYSMFKKHTLKNVKQEKQKLVNLANQVNEFEQIGEIDCYESIGENAKFMEWYSKLYGIVKTEKETKND